MFYVLDSLPTELLMYQFIIDSILRIVNVCFPPGISIVYYSSRLQMASRLLTSCLILITLQCGVHQGSVLGHFKLRLH